jgi:hypothetical protein
MFALLLSEGNSVLAASAGGAGGLAQLELVSKNIVGVVLFPDGETPVESLPIRVWDIDNRKMVHKSKTDADGVFRIPQTDVQRCYIFVGKVKIDTRMLAKNTGTLQQTHNIVVVLSRPMLIAGHSKIFDVIIAPVLMQPPDEPRVVSP